MMREINFHRNNTLYSIKPIEDIYGDREYYKGILNRLLARSETVIVKGMRPIFKVEQSPEAIIGIRMGVEKLIKEDDWFSFAFLYHKKEDNDEFTDVCLKIWFEYESPGFIFLVDLEEDRILNKIIEDKFMPWDQMAKLTPCYILFKSIEDDVVWIGRSTDLEIEKILEP
jgi:hypothetical protein